MPGVKMVEALAQCGAVAVLSPAREPRASSRSSPASTTSASSASSGRATCSTLECEVEARPRARRRRARSGRRVGGELAVRGTLTVRGGRRMIGRSDRDAGVRSPASAATSPSGSDERRPRASSSTRPTSGSASAPASASGGSRRRRRRSPTSRCPPARGALEQAGRRGARHRPADRRHVTPDMAFPSTAAILADTLGMPRRGRLRPLGRLHRLHVRARPGLRRCSRRGLAQRALVVGGDVLSKILDWSDRSTLVLFGDGAGAVVLEPCRSGGFLGFELGADGGGGESLWLPGSGSRLFEDPERFVKMNGREVFKFATRVMVSRPRRSLARVRQDTSRTWTFMFRIRPTSGSSTTLRGSSASRRRRSSSTSIATATPHRARSRSRSPMRPTTAGSAREARADDREWAPASPGARR